MPCSGTDTEHTGKAIRTDIGQGTRQNEKQDQKEHTQKKNQHTTKSNPQEQSKTTQTEKQAIPTTKAENQKLYLPKRNHGRLALGYANSAENGGIAGISHRRAGFGADIVTNFVEMT